MKTPKTLLGICTVITVWLGFTAEALPQAETSTVKVDPKVLTSYVGQYELAPGFTITIRKENDRLTVQATGQTKVTLSARSETDFFLTVADVSMTFVKNKDGKVTHLVLHQNGDHDATKTSDEVPKERVAIKVDPKTYDAYVGQYELAPGQVFVIRRQGDRLRAQLTGQPSFEVFPESETKFFYRLVDAQLTFVKDKDGKVTHLVLHQNGDQQAKKLSNDVPKLRVPDLSKIPARDPKAGPQLIDLSTKYNALLTECWHPDSGSSSLSENHLASLPRGVQKLGGVEFDVRGLIQVNGTQADQIGADFPNEVKGIKIGRKCQRLHLLLGTGWPAEDGATIGRYLLHYVGGQQAEIPIIYGNDVRDWWLAPNQPKEAKSATIAWTGSNPASDSAGCSLRLFKNTHDNPKPDLEVESLDFVSALSDSAPFVIAITVE
jgi:hypothetical protein